MFTDYPQQRQYGAYISARVSSDDMPTVRCEIYIPGYGRDNSGLAAIRPGDVYALEAEFTLQAEDSYSAVRGTYLVGYAVDDLEYMHHSASALYIPRIIAHAMGESINRVFPMGYAPFMRALLIGDQYDLSRDTKLYNELGYSGITHIVSVSGMHVSFLISMVSLFVRDKRKLAMFGIPVLLLFCGMVGFSPPVTRAVVMQIFVLMAPLFRRRSDGVTSVFAALLLLLLINPYSAANIGLQLSFLSTLGLVAFTSRLNRRLNRALNSLSDRHKFLANSHVNAAMKTLIANLATTVGALIFTLPLLAYYFGYVSIIAPVTNLVTLFAASAAFCVGLVASLLGLVSQMLGVAAAGVAVVPSWWVLTAAKLLARVPFAAVFVSNGFMIAWFVYFYAIFGVTAAMRVRLRQMLYPVCAALCMFCLSLVLTAATARRGTELTVINVEQGQCLAVTDGAETALIDCGSLTANAAQSAERFLQSRGTTDISLMILTHFHFDHAGAVTELFERHRVTALVIPAPPPAGVDPLADEIIALAIRRKIDIIYIVKETRLTLAGTTLTLYPPNRDGIDETAVGNELCLSILVSRGDWDALVTGDMGSQDEDYLVSNYDLPDIEVFVAGHHGSKYASSDELLDALTPEVAVISVGARNTFGHPAPETLARFAERGIAVYRTDLNGNITLRAVPGISISEGSANNSSED
jgi:competence protein ComEC